MRYPVETAADDLPARWPLQGNTHLSLLESQVIGLPPAQVGQLGQPQNTYVLSQEEGYPTNFKSQWQAFRHEHLPAASAEAQVTKVSNLNWVNNQNPGKEHYSLP